MHPKKIPGSVTVTINIIVKLYFTIVFNSKNWKNTQHSQMVVLILLFGPAVLGNQ